jgi:hypothetical protein
MKSSRGPPSDVGFLDDGRGDGERIVFANILGAPFWGKEHVATADQAGEPAFADQIADDLARGLFGAEQTDDIGSFDNVALLLAEREDDLCLRRPKGAKSSFNNF